MTATTPERAYMALSYAAERIGAHNYATGNGVTTVTRKRRTERRYTPTTAHRGVIDAMAAVMDGAITPAAAMAVLWEWDTMVERGLTP